MVEVGKKALHSVQTEEAPSPKVESVMSAMHSVLESAVLQTYQDRIVPILNDIKHKMDTILDNHAQALSRLQAVNLTASRLLIQNIEGLTYEKLYALTILAEEALKVPEDQAQLTIYSFLSGALESEVDTGVQKLIAEMEESNDQADRSDSKSNQTQK